MKRKPVGLKELAKKILRADKNISNREQAMAILNKSKQFISVPDHFMSKASRHMFDEEWKPGQNPIKTQKRKILRYQKDFGEEKMDDYLGPKIPSLLEFLENKIRIRKANGTM